MGETDTATVIAHTREGNIIKYLGTRLKGCDGDEYCAFKGIPYAKPPVGELRFSDPEPLELSKSFENLEIHAKSHKDNCPQWDFAINKVIGSDNCLHINVYTKSWGTGIKRPVMVWIHWGAFVYGNGDDSNFGPDYLMKKDIVLVSINYRIGVLGFLNLNDEAATGNQGLKDQVMALRWIRDNIADFGGDPDNVTIFGDSAGGVSVHYLTISPLAKGLFHKAIVQSGTAVNPWAFHSNPEEKAYQLCELLGHKDRGPKSILRFLRSLDVEKLIEAQEKLLSPEEKLQFAFPFGPSIDSKSKNPFLPVHPEILAIEGIQVPLMIGHTSREFIFFSKTIGEDYIRFNKEFDELLHPNALHTLKIYGITTEALKRFYFRKDSVTEENLDKLIDLLGDIHMVEGIHRTIKTQIEKSSAATYYYQYTYDKEPSFMKIMYDTSMSGACHLDDLQHLFRAHSVVGAYEFPKRGSDKYRITEQMVELWTNFATTGRPTLSRPSELIPFHWQPVNDATVLRYLNICEDLHMEVALNLGRRYTAHRQ